MPTPGTTSGTFAFAPSYAQIMLEAYERIQVEPTSPEHALTGVRSINLLAVEAANRGVNLWLMDLQTIALVQGTEVYSLPQETVNIQEAYISYSSPVTDRIMTAISRTDYAAIAQKTQQGFPTTYYMDRQKTPLVYLWLTPDGNGPYTMKYNRMRRIQDADIAMGETADIPYRFFDWIVAALAAKLAEKLKSAVHAEKLALAERAWSIAAAEDRERTPVTMAPEFSAYRVL